MQPISNNNLQIQLPTLIQNNPTEQKLAPVSASKGKNETKLPEDIVNLYSASKAPTQNTSQSRTPSTPVSHPEKISLLKTSNGNMSFSTYV